MTTNNETPELEERAERPCYFGSPDRPIFGWFHPAQTSLTRDCAVVLCYPIGFEYYRAYPFFRQLALRLSQAGFPVLRFDYDGTGNSAGTDADSGRVKRWVDSIGLAMDEIRTLSGLSRVSLFGLRLGGSLAMTAAIERGDAEGVALFTPCLRGKGFVREIQIYAQLGKSSTPPKTSEGDGFAGLLMTEETISDLAKIDLLKTTGSLKNMLLIARDTFPDEHRRLTNTGGQFEYQALPGYEGMMVDAMDTGVLPEKVLSVVTDWFARIFPMGTVAVKGADCKRPLARIASASSTSAISEEPLCFGASHQHFGILSTPETPVPGRPVILLLNSGALPHVGPHRIYVNMARRWASLGFPVFRCDIGSIGDSASNRGWDLDGLYADDTLKEIESAIAFLHHHTGCNQFILSGICLGAYATFQLALRNLSKKGLTIKGGMLINPLTFYWKQGTPLTSLPSHVHSYWSQYRQSLLQKEAWKKVVASPAILKRVLSMAIKRMGMITKAKWESFIHYMGYQKEDIASDLSRISNAGIDLLFVFGSEEYGRDYLNLHAREAIKKLSQRGNFKIEIIQDTDHTFTPLQAQSALSDVLTNHLMKQINGM